MEEKKDLKNPNENNNGEIGEKQPKEGFIKKGKRGWIRFSTSKGGKITLKVIRFGADALAILKILDMCGVGKKPKEPATVVIQEGVQDEIAPMEEPEVDETVNEMDEEVTE